MLVIDCPYCGPRPELEFTYGGQAHIARPADPSKVGVDDWAGFLYLTVMVDACLLVSPVLRSEVGVSSRSAGPPWIAALSGVALVWLRIPAVFVCLLGGILGGVAAAAVLGLSIPSLLHLLRRDPQVAAGTRAVAVLSLAANRARSGGHDYPCRSAPLDR